MSFLNRIRKLDWLLTTFVLIIIGLGVATFHHIGGTRASMIVHRQIIFAVLGVAVMIAVSFLDYRIFKNYSRTSIVLYVLGIILLLVALANREIRGVSSWIIISNTT